MALLETLALTVLSTIWDVLPIVVIVIDAERIIIEVVTKVVVTEIIVIEIVEQVLVHGVHGFGLAGLLLVGMTALSARLGVSLDGTLCEELARRTGRPLAMLTGLSLFLIAACFQFGNNLGVLFAIEPFLDDSAMADSIASSRPI